MGRTRMRASRFSSYALFRSEPLLSGPVLGATAPAGTAAEVSPGMSSVSARCRAAFAEKVCLSAVDVASGRPMVSARWRALVGAASAAVSTGRSRVSARTKVALVASSSPPSIDIDMAMARLSAASS